MNIIWSEDIEFNDASLEFDPPRAVASLHGYISKRSAKYKFTTSQLNSRVSHGYFFPMALAESSFQRVFDANKTDLNSGNELTEQTIQALDEFFGSPDGNPLPNPTLAWGGHNFTLNP